MNSSWMKILIVFSGLALLSSAQSSRTGKAVWSPEAAKVKNEIQDKARALYGDDTLTIAFASDKGFRDMTSKGDVESGVVLREAGDKTEIFLDKDPCNGKIIAFHKPYTKQDAGRVKCAGKDLPKVIVTQK